MGLGHGTWGQDPPLDLSWVRPQVQDLGPGLRRDIGPRANNRPSHPGPWAWTWDPTLGPGPISQGPLEATRAHDEMMDDYLTNPDQEDSTELGEVPHEEEKGSILQHNLFAPYLYGRYTY